MRVRAFSDLGDDQLLHMSGMWRPKRLGYCCWHVVRYRCDFMAAGRAFANMSPTATDKDGRLLPFVRQLRKVSVNWLAPNLHRSRFPAIGLTIETPPPPNSNCTKKSIHFTKTKTAPLSWAV